ncbi:hypothetical protein DPMN_069369 [Dreissena polymorpha]|uniref:Uncharacterized protein n=1 Tax=Dreissena polymorpha TaxID=45954 RepID=A0A9D3Z488_DREPO|nr:hypothetical protein DPMN_069369 [Dreissena polymorpha]
MSFMTYATSVTTAHPANSHRLVRSYHVHNNLTQGFVVSLTDRAAPDQTRTGWSRAV